MTEALHSVHTDLSQGKGRFKSVVFKAGPAEQPTEIEEK